MKKGQLSNLEEKLFQAINKHGLEFVTEKLDELSKNKNSAIGKYKIVERICLRVCNVTRNEVQNPNDKNEDTVDCRQLLAYFTLNKVDISEKVLATLMNVTDRSVRNYKSKVPERVRDEKFNQKFVNKFEQVEKQLENE